MKVKELIAELQKFDPNLRVVVTSDYSKWHDGLHIDRFAVEVVSFGWDEDIATIMLKSAYPSIEGIEILDRAGEENDRYDEDGFRLSSKEKKAREQDFENQMQIYEGSELVIDQYVDRRRTK